MTMQKDDVTGRAFSISCIIVLSSLSPSPPIRLDNGGCTGHLLILTTRVEAFATWRSFFAPFGTVCLKRCSCFGEGFLPTRRGVNENIVATVLN